MEKCYQVVHWYDVDGGFGDAISNTDVIATFKNKEDAEKFVEKYKDPYVYDTPYQDLHCGDLEISEIDILDSIDDFKEDPNELWWIYDETP